MLGTSVSSAASRWTIGVYLPVSLAVDSWERVMWMGRRLTKWDAFRFGWADVLGVEGLAVSWYSTFSMLSLACVAIDRKSVV